MPRPKKKKPKKKPEKLIAKGTGRYEIWRDENGFGKIIIYTNKELNPIKLKEPED